MKNRRALASIALGLAPALLAQKQTPPAPAEPRGFSVPAPKTLALDNGLAVTLVPYGTVPKVTVRLAVLTGNLEPIAHLKLARAGLGAFFEHGQGGFGSDHEDRTELPAIARARAGGYPRAQTVIIGDTPRDIACARADEVRCIAVATGPYSAAELDGADVVLETAHDLLAVL